MTLAVLQFLDAVDDQIGRFFNLFMGIAPPDGQSKGPHPYLRWNAHSRQHVGKGNRPIMARSACGCHNGWQSVKDLFPLNMWNGNVECIWEPFSGMPI